MIPAHKVPRRELCIHIVSPTHAPRTCQANLFYTKSNPTHRNMTPARYTFFHYYFSKTCFSHSFDHHYVEKWNETCHINNNNNKRPYKRNTAHVECKNKGDTSNNRATGTISKSFRKYVSNIPGNHEVKELQKTAILGTAHIFRKSTNVKVQ